ncbi:MAG: hypothetical protein Q8P31_00345 [Bacillota bacterium]|nr:hypothetical protein [Bacillota bacterium]
MQFVIFLIAIVLVAAWRLSTRYKYSQKAQRVLSLSAAGALVISVIFNLWLFPGLNLLYLILAVAGVFLPVYSLIALAIVEAWRKRKQSLFDASIGALRSEEERILETITRNQQQLALAEHKRQTLEQLHREKLSDQRRIRDFLETWERGNGLARIRSIKIQEWREGFGGMSREDLEQRRAELCAQLDETEVKMRDEPGLQERVEQLRAQVSVASLVLLGGTLAQPNSELGGLERKANEATADKAEAERRLEAIRLQLSDWERRRDEFLADQIVLGN